MLGPSGLSLAHHTTSLQRYEDIKLALDDMERHVVDHSFVQRGSILIINTNIQLITTKTPDIGPQITMATCDKAPKGFEITNGRYMRVPTIMLIWTTIAVLIAYQGGSIALAVIYLRTDSAGFSSQDSAFALYKNSQFEECSNLAPTNFDCARIYDRQFLASGIDVQNSDRDPSYFISELDYNVTLSNGKPDPNRFDWCDVVRCLKDFKIVPSKPRDSAFRYNAVLAFAFLNTACTFALWDYWNIGMNKKPKCQKLGVVDWAKNVYDFSVFVWWWYAFARLASDSTRYAPADIFAWTSTWRQAWNLDYHPVACQFEPRSRLKRTLSGILRVATALQWVGTCYILSVIGRDIFRTEATFRTPKYDCLQPQIASAPGSTTCTPDHICAKDWLFADPGFDSGSKHAKDVAWRFISIALFAFLSLMLFWPLLYQVIKSILFEFKGKKYYRESRKKDWREWNVGPIMAISILAILCVIYGIIIFAEIRVTLREVGREAVVAYDKDCHAAHVTMSSWRDYLDVDGYNRGVRIAREWFGA
jgi:hypothetical protein